MTQATSCIEIMQEFSQSLEALAILIANALLPAFQELNKTVLKWYEWYIQRQREEMAIRLIDRGVPIVLANWVAGWWPERWLPKLL